MNQRIKIQHYQINPAFILIEKTVKPQLPVEKQMESTLLNRLTFIKSEPKVDSIFIQPLITEVLLDVSNIT